MLRLHISSKDKIREAVKQTAEHHHHQTVLLQQLQALEMVELYREWCYQLYLALTYNPLNKPYAIKGKNGKTVKFYYGIGGKRYIKQTADATTYYIGKAYEEEVHGSQKKQTCFISIGGKTIGTHVEKIDETYSINKKNPKYKQTYNRYFHMDALGSITAVTDDHAKVVERRSYDAFGKIRSMDYGLDSSHAIIPANTVSQTTRAYTGHEQIKEVDGLIHMNARVYDSEIGRFLSADTMIPSPYASQSYNRYSYVRNNPMMFTDPTGHCCSFIKKAFKRAKKWVKKHARAIGAIVASAVVAFVAPYLLPAMGTYATAAATGALAGAAAGAIQTKSLKGALKGALYGALGAVAAVGVVQVTAKVFNITKTLAHSSNFINSGINKVTAFKTAAHGLVRGAIQSLQGGSFKAGFMSGVSSAFDVGTKAFGNGVGGFIARSTAMGIAGGTASALGGGKFSNGAMSGAFTHMFNTENVINKAKTYFETVGATVSGIFGVTAEVGYYHNNTERGLLLTGGGTAGIDASVNVKAGYVKGNASTLDGWFTSATTSIVYGEGTALFSGGKYVGASGGASFGFLPATATVAQTYTVRIPLGSATYNSRISHMVED